MPDEPIGIAENAAELEQIERKWGEEVREQLLEADLPADEILQPIPEGVSFQEWAGELTEKWEDKCRQAGLPGVPVVLRGTVASEPELVWEE